MAVIIDGGSNDKLPKSGGRKVFVGGGGRRDGRSVSWSAMVGKSLVIVQRRRGINPSYDRLGRGGGVLWQWR